MKRNEARESKLREQCQILADAIISIRPIYLTAQAGQRALLETMIGAAIWYIPKPPQAWSGFISIGTLKAFHPDSGVLQPKVSEEHIYPRKVAARQLLEDEELSGARLCILFKEKYGRLHFITSDENKSVQRYQRVDVFTTSEEAYAKAGIHLIQVLEGDLRLIKRRDRSTIERYLTTSLESCSESTV